MNVDKLRGRLSKLEDKIEQMEGKLERHQIKVQKQIKKIEDQGWSVPEGTTDFSSLKWDSEDQSTEIYWDVCDLESKMETARNTEKKIKEEKQRKDQMISQLAEHGKTFTSEIIGEQPLRHLRTFVEQWEQDVVRHYHQELIHFMNERIDIVIGDPEKTDSEVLKELQKKYPASFPILYKFIGMKDSQEWTDWVIELVREERERRLIDMINRVYNYVGKIEELQNVSTNEKGNFDATVVGEEGKAILSTIPVGGYNIKSFHFRTTVTKLKGDE